MSEIRDAYRKLVRRQYRGWFFAAAAVLVAELSFDVVERGIGRYLLWHNSDRQKVGRSWEAAQSRLLAGTRLEEAQQAVRQRANALEDLTNLDRLLQFVRLNQQAILPASPFGVVYRSLPEIFQPLLVPPEVLLAAIHDGRLASVLCSFKDSALAISLLDDQDRAFFQTRLGNEQLQMIARHNMEQPLRAMSAERFAQRVFSSDEFYRGLQQLSPQERAWLLRQLPILTEPEKRFTHFAVSDQMSGGFVEVAFAIDTYHSRIFYLPEAWLIEVLLPALYEKHFHLFE